MRQLLAVLAMATGLALHLPAAVSAPRPGEIPCISEIYGDRLENLPVDAFFYSFTAYCTTGSFNWVISTLGAMSAADVASVQFALDVDNDPATGCNGADYALGRASSIATLFRIPNCDPGTFTAVGNSDVVVEPAGPDGVHIAFSIPALAGFRGTLRWWASLGSGSSTDRLPDSGANQSTATPPPPPPGPFTPPSGLPLPDPVIPPTPNSGPRITYRPFDSLPLPPGTVMCDYPRWPDAQIAYEKDRLSAPVDIDVATGVLCSTLAGAPAAQPPAATGAGYVMVEATGTVFGFGDMLPLTPAVTNLVVAIAAGPHGGYWTLGRNGIVDGRGVTAFGQIDWSRLVPGERPMTIAGTPDGTGYWVFTNRGRVMAYGSATTHGDMIGTTLRGEIVASAVTPTGAGYWMVGSDGGIFAFGDATFYGSMGGTTLNKPVVGIATDPDGDGYWLVASDGGIFAFSAAFKGSTGDRPLNAPVIGALAYGDGYLMVASDGGIFSFSSKPFLGSLGGNPPPNPIVGVAVRSD